MHAFVEKVPASLTLTLTLTLVLTLTPTLVVATLLLEMKSADASLMTGDERPKRECKGWV